MPTIRRDIPAFRSQGGLVQARFASVGIGVGWKPGHSSTQLAGGICLSCRVKVGCLWRRSDFALRDRRTKRRWRAISEIMYEVGQLLGGLYLGNRTNSVYPNLEKGKP